MPSIDEQGKGYELEVAASFGQAVSARRSALKLSASELSRRTADLGYPISRGAIAKIESNLRSGKIDVAEWLVLSAALDIPPVLLLFPHFPEGRYMAALPNAVVRATEAVHWVSGRAKLPTDADDGQDVATNPNDGMMLIGASESLNRALNARLAIMERNSPVHGALPGEAADDAQMLEMANARIEAARAGIGAYYKNVWGSEYEPQEQD